MISHIFHVSDIHILDKNYKNIRNSWKRLVSDIVSFRNNKANILLVITGDIFEFKTHMNSDDVHIFYELIMQLEMNQIRTVIIPGNHDYNINSKCAQDNISILLGQECGSRDAPNIGGLELSPLWKYVQCYPKTGIYTIENIQFYVYSPIDKVIPQILEVEGKVKIALLHEPVISAKFDNSAIIYNGRFKQDDFTNYDIVMMGDIHHPQFLAPNMAYAGSFVQKNKGEGLNHGYILWDICARAGNHIWIPLKEIALKIVAKDNKFVAPLPEIVAEITYLGFIYKDCSADWLKSAAIIIREKYKRPITQIIRHDSTQKLKIDIANTLQMDTSKFSHTNLIIQMLQKSNTNDAMISRVLDYHNRFLQNRQLCPTVRYYIKYLSWSNVFCYGPNNYINFEELHGLIALAGKNKIGKSSVIDILIRILFNECERGHKDDVINKHAKTAYIKCCFRIVNDEYIIEQSWQRYTSATSFHLYKNGEEITKDTLIKTYKYIREDLGLGNYKDFVNLTTALQNRKFIIDLDKKDIYSLLCKLLDIDTMRDIEEHVKKERDFLKREKKIYLKELDGLGPEENREEAWEKEIHRIELCHEENSKNKYVIETKLDVVRETLYKLNRQIQDIDLPSDWEPHQVNEIPLPYSPTEFIEIKKQLDKLKIDFAVNKEKMLQFDRARIKQIKIESNLLNGQPLSDELVKLNTMKLWNIDNFKTQYCYEELVQYPSCEYNIDELYRQLVSCNQSSIIQISKPTGLNVETLQQQLDEYKDAKQNLALYKARRSVAHEILEGIKNTNIGVDGMTFLTTTYDKYRNQHSTAKQASKINLDEVNEAIKEWHEYERIHSNNLIIQSNLLIEKQIHEYNTYINVKHDLLQHKRTKENNEILNARHICQQYEDFIYKNDYTKIKDYLLQIKEQVEILKATIMEYENADAQRQEFINYDNNLTKYKQRQINISNDASIDELKNGEHDLLTELKKIETSIQNFNINIENIKNLSIRYTEIKNKIVELDDTLNLYDTYHGCINHKTGIPSNILRQVCVVLTERCNEILNNITDFNVEFTFEDEIKIYTIAKGSGDNNMKLSASLGSGFQKFLLDMILRIVLTRISNISNPNILFVDEGFGCMDKENFLSVCGCLIKLKDNFDAMIVITHIPELHTYMDQIMEVQNENGNSNLQFGQLTLNEYDLFENANLRIMKESIDNNKSNKIDSSKRIKDKNPEIIMSKETAKTVNDAETTNGAETANDAPLPVNIWDNHKEELGHHFNIADADINLIITEIQARIIQQVDDKFTCQPCQKSFKKQEQINAHILAKTYKSKHYKFIISTIITPN